MIHQCNGSVKETSLKTNSKEVNADLNEVSDDVNSRLPISSQQKNNTIKYKIQLGHL